MALNGNERDFCKIVKKSGMDVRSWNFFTPKIQPSSKCEKKFSSDCWKIVKKSEMGAQSWNFFHIQTRVVSWCKKNFKKNFSSVHPFLIFLQFFKNPHLNTWCRIASSAFARWLNITTFRPCVMWAVIRGVRSHGPLHTRLECRNLPSRSEGWWRDAPLCI